MGFKFLEHTADVKILVKEKTLGKAFASSAMAMKEVMAEQIKVASKITKKFSVKGQDRESLLYAFLEEFIYLVDAKDFILSKITLIKIKENKDKNKFLLEAKIAGDKASNYQFTNKVKAITYNNMSIKEKKGDTTIIFVLDV